MRRWGAAAVALGGLTLGVALQPSASSAGEPGPACADFVSGSWAYSLTSEPSRGVVTVYADLASPSCPALDYGLTVLDETGARLLARSSISGGAGQTLVLRASVPADPLLPPSMVCIYGTTSRAGRLYDRAPDSGCISVSSRTHGDGAWS